VGLLPEWRTWLGGRDLTCAALVRAALTFRGLRSDLENRGPHNLGMVKLTILDLNSEVRFFCRRL